ncbi:MAG: hypothetical protein WHS89_01530, partial [Acidimicrobiales bacterium]
MSTAFSMPSRALSRQRLAIITAVALMVATVVILRLPGGAGADSQTSTVSANCSALGINLSATVPITVTDTPDPATEGGQVTLDIESGLPTLSLTVTINSATINIPIPSQVQSVDSVTFTGGNVTGSWSATATNLALTYTGPISSSSIQIPKATIVQTLKPGTAGQTVQWKTFSSIVSNAVLGSTPLTANCTPANPNQVLNTTAIQAPPTTTTTAPPTTTTTAP